MKIQIKYWQNDMWVNNFTLIEKKLLTLDVFELVFEAENDFEMLPGQFLTFLLPKTGFGRAYSVLYKREKRVYFIIKRLENGRGGSKEICDYDMWVVLKWVWPSGHFTLWKKENSKIFIGTGTGMVPLYCMIEKLLSSWYSQNIYLCLWNRTLSDMYYLNVFSSWKQKYPNFEFIVYLSREEKVGYKKGYVGDFFHQENIKNFDEFYICGNPNMVDEVEKKLQSLAVEKENIFKEKY